jgi:uracil-DNA glycosylase
MQTQNCLLQKSGKIYIHLNEISLTQYGHKIMPSYHLHTSNDNAEKNTGKHLEQSLAQGASAETAHFVTIQENYLLSH